ncbi:Pr6Pr family membrane protein [Micromonospora sp. RP3T]|uniref:Pr6Pr family membrane protein n=1 Tax=Micromonospora sp. RP3T TaxID=2135446 RepID=UPI0018ECED37|nr:Pr6Pr family membrane protein [Micromonospora sp. RP3T]
MTPRRRRPAILLRLALVLGVVAGIVLTALGPATVTGLLPYFTIQSNVAVGVLAGYAAWCAARDRPEPPSALKGAVTLYITITGTVYHLVLANPASPFAMAQPHREPGEWWGNQLLHTVVPLLAIADWALFDRRGRLRPRYAAWWLVFPLAYLGFALMRGLVVHRYPYPFLDAGQLGYDGVGLSALGFAAVFWLLGLLFVGVDRLLARAGAAPAAPVGGPLSPATEPTTPANRGAG